MIIYLYEEHVVFECEECGETFVLTYPEFEEFLDEEGLVIEDYFLEACDEDFDEEDEIDAYEELDEELVELMDEMRLCRESEDYEGYAILAEAYAVLFDILY